VWVIAANEGLLFAGAVLAAVIAVVAAQWRLHQQLKTQTEQFGHNLEAEADRFSRQLAHNRVLNEIEDLRRILDDGLATSGSKWASFVHTAGVALSEGFKTADVRTEWTVDDLNAIVNRLLLRLGGHPVVDAFREVKEELDSEGEAMQELVLARVKAEFGERAVAELSQSLGPKQRAFVDSAPSVDDAHVKFDEMHEASRGALDKYVSRAQSLVDQRIAAVEEPR
jgi:hypothetical protein